MSTDTHKWTGSYPQVSKKKMMWLNSCGKQHLSSTSVKKENGDHRETNITDIFNIASVMSLWQNSDAQAPCQAPQQNQIQRGAQHDAKRFRTKTGTQSSSVFNVNTPPLHFRVEPRYRSKVTSLCVSSRQTFNLLKPTTFPVNPSEGKINEVGISKDFGNDCIIFKDDTDTIKASYFSGQVEQNCRIQTRKFGECETVQTSIKKRHKNIELQSSSLIVLGILPILTSVIELKYFTQLLGSKIHVLKKLISFAITFRMFLMSAFLKKCAYLQVNKTLFRESNEKNKNLNLNVSSVSVVSKVLSDMAFNQQMYPDWRMEEDDMLPREEDESEGQDDTNYRRVPDWPNFYEESGDNGDGDDENVALWDDRFMGQPPQPVLEGLAGGPVPINYEPHQLEDEIANNVLVDDDVIAAILHDVNAADLPMQEDFPLFDDDQLVIGEIMFVDLLGHVDAAEAA